MGQRLVGTAFGPASMFTLVAKSFANN